jgi:hypothetical protein
LGVWDQNKFNNSRMMARTFPWANRPSVALFSNNDILKLYTHKMYWLLNGRVDFAFAWHWAQWLWRLVHTC